VSYKAGYETAETITAARPSDKAAALCRAADAGQRVPNRTVQLVTALRVTEGVAWLAFSTDMGAVGKALLCHASDQAVRVGQ
jgi:hypothetical protein